MVPRAASGTFSCRSPCSAVSVLPLRHARKTVSGCSRSASSCGSIAPSPTCAHAAAAKLGRPFDGVADLVGGLLLESLPALAEGAQAATIVDLDGDFDEAIDRNVSLHGVLLRPGRDLLVELAAAVDAGLRPTISATYPLARAAEAHRRLERGGVGGKIALTP